MSEDITEYEKERLRNIERNKKYFSQLFSKNIKKTEEEHSNYISTEDLSQDEVFQNTQIRQRQRREKKKQTTEALEIQKKRKIKIKENSYQTQINLAFDTLYKEIEPKPRIDNLNECSNCYNRESEKYFNGPGGFYSLCLDCSIDFYSGKLKLNENGMNKLGIFFSGAFLSAGVGYFQLYKDFNETKTILESNIKETRDSILDKNLKIEKKVNDNEQKITILLEHTTEIDRELLNLIKDTNKLKKYAKQLQQEE
eukprot:gene10820-3438_t